MSGVTFRPKVAGVVLAAGASNRMKGIKQLLPWKKTTLLGHAINQLLQSGVEKVFVVLGANENIISEQVKTENIELISNAKWKDGMSSSIVKIIEYFEEMNFDFDGLLIAVCDQPLLDNNHYKKLVMSCISQDRIIVSSYGDQVGVPALFGKNFFSELKELKHDYGAKSVIQKHLSKMIQLDAPNGLIDLDTMEQYNHYYTAFG